MPAKRFPPIPTSIDAPSGRIDIVLSDTLDGPGEDKESTCTMGEYHYLNRVISVRRKMTRRQQWFTLFHEFVHLWLHESGLANGLVNELEEAICDGIATGMMRWYFGDKIPSN